MKAAERASSKSRKSESDSKPPRKLRWATKRGTYVRYLDPEAILSGGEPHLKFIYAAYRMGDLPDVQAGLDREAFVDYAAAYVAALRNVMLSISKEPFKGGHEKPLAIVVAGERDNIVEPHAIWFSWATDRNKLEAGLAFLDQLRKNGKIALVTTPKGTKDEAFHHRICKYGVARCVGHIQGYFGEYEDAVLFQTKPVRHGQQEI